MTDVHDDVTAAEADADPGVAITVDGRTVSARPGELVIDACERADVYVPRFCYHPRMRPVGMCRQCLVEIDTGRGPALQPSCMIEVSEGMTVETGSPVTIKAQTGVLEFLLVNHPLDCPVCDKGGECPLQDQAMSHGPGESRMVEEKRHFEKPIPVSDLVLLDRERCILCDRCTRFAKEVAGEPLIHFQDRGGSTQVNTFPDHPFASYYSGNTVQICPVGALTSTSYRFKARPWDLQQVESTCRGCAMGCRIGVDVSRNRVLRQHGVDVDPVNWGWLCDKGRFGFEAIESDARLAAPLLRPAGAGGTGRGELAEASWSAALGAAAAALDTARRSSGPGSIAVLGGARLTNEDAYAWAKLAKGVLGTDHVDAQMADGLPAELVLGRPRATIDELCRPGGTVLWIGPDPREELAVLYLRLRHAVVEDGVRLVAVTPTATALDGLARAAFHPVPGDLPALVAALLDRGDAPEGTDGATLAAARELLAGDDLTVALGRGSTAEAVGYTVDAAAVVARTRPEARTLPLLRRANVHGALDMGLAPGLLPGRTTLATGADRVAPVWSTVPTEPGLDATGILTAAAEGRVDVLVLLGADPLADHPDREMAARALATTRTVIATDLFLTESSGRADVVLPVAGPNESAGTVTNVEGRVSTVARAVTPPGTARPDWMVAAELARRLGHDLGLESVEDIWSEIEAVSPAHAGLTAARLAASADGVVVPLPAPPIATGAEDDSAAGTGAEADGSDGDGTAVDAEVPEAGDGATSAAGSEAVDADPSVAGSQAEAPEPSGEGAAHAREPGPAGDGADEPSPGAPSSPFVTFVAPDAPTPVPPVDAYALRLVVARTMYDDGTFTAQAPSLAGLAADAVLRVHPTVLDRLGVAPGARVRATSPRATVTLPVAADPGVPRGVAAVARRRRAGGAGDLVDPAAPVTEIRVETA